MAYRWGGGWLAPDMLNHQSTGKIGNRNFVSNRPDHPEFHWIMDVKTTADIGGSGQLITIIATTYRTLSGDGYRARSSVNTHLRVFLVASTTAGMWCG